MKSIVSLLSIIVAASSSVAAGNEVPEEWQTVAERSDFRATSTYAETMEFLARVAAASPVIRLSDFGLSAAGRPLPLVVVSADGRFTPQAASASDTAVLIIVSCIHAGEVDGKDATLMLLRDIAVGHRNAPSGTVLLFAPIYNADGHERSSPFNRPNQDGPVEGMGYRVTANGLNLNRDHMRLASPEARAQVDLFNRWRPHLHIDNHVTNGSDHGWVLTWKVAEAPFLAAPVDRWLQDHLPKALAATRDAGHPSGPYVWLADGTDPSKGIRMMSFSPRFSTDYFPLRHRPSILVEMHAHKPFRDRVLANRDFLLAVIAEVERDPEALVAAIAEAEATTVSLGRPEAEPSRVVVRWRPSKASEPISWPTFSWYVEPSTVTGSDLLRFRQDERLELEVPWFHTFEADLTLPRPRGYVVLPGWPQIESLVTAHGLHFRRLTTEFETEVETIRVAKPKLGERPYQGTVMVEESEVSRQSERRVVPAGSLWIPASQPDFEVAVQLFEPEAPDSMLAWGLLSSVFERKEYIDRRVLEGMAEEMLRDDSMRREWQMALEDEDFAADTTARYLWWYERTPFWDEQVGLVPVFRMMGAPVATTDDGRPEPERPPSTPLRPE